MQLSETTDTHLIRYKFNRALNFVFIYARSNIMNFYSALIDYNILGQMMQFMGTKSKAWAPSSSQWRSQTFHEGGSNYEEVNTRKKPRGFNIYRTHIKYIILTRYTSVIFHRMNSLTPTWLRPGGSIIIISSSIPM